MDLDEALKNIKEEYLRAVKKYGVIDDAHQGYALILEELDELWDKVKLRPNTIDRLNSMRIEAIQVGAMAIRFIINSCECKNNEVL